MTTLRMAICSSVLLAATGAGATGVYLNGVQVDGMANQKFTGATVTFDEKGNVHIDVPGVEVKTLGAQAQTAATPPPPAALTKHYFVVGQKAALGMSGYDIDVFVDGKWVQRLRDNEEENPIDITKYLAPGANKVLFTAHKAKGERKSFSPSHTFTVLVGEGSASSDQVVIDDTLATFKRSAADTDDVTQEFPITAR